MNPEDARLKALLQEARPSPSLPPRFRENVWRRIEGAEAPAAGIGWLEAAVTLLLRPRFAYATVGLLMLLGMLLGAHEGSKTARASAEAQYVASVAPNALR
jgi:hypothetical protein